MKPLSIIVIGASVGGEQALKTFFENIPPDSDAAYLVNSHPSPDRSSSLTQILQSVSKIPVEQVTEKVLAEPNRIYVASPNECLSIQGDYIVVSPVSAPEERLAPVDIFFSTPDEPDRPVERQMSIFNATLSNITDFAYIFDREGRFVYANQQLLDLFAVTSEEIIGRNFFDLNYPPELAARLQRQIRQVYDTGETVRDETPFTNFSGKDGYYEYIFSPVKTEGGAIEFVAGSTRDVTMRKQAEESIRFQAHLLNTVEHSVIATDLNGTITYWNRYAEKLYGWTEAEVVGRNIMDFTTPDTQFESADEIMLQLRQGKSWAGEFMVRRRGGATFPAQVVNSPITDENGNLIGIVGVSFDITQRKRAEMNAAFLADISKDLAELTGADEIIQTVGTKLGEFLGVSHCLFAEIDESRDTATVEVAWRAAGETDLVGGIYRRTEFLNEELLETARAGETIVVDDTQNDRRVNPENYAAINFYSFIIEPFVRGDEWKALLSISDSAARDWQPDEIELVREITHRVFVRLERSRAEKILSENQKQYEALVWTSAQIVWTTDAQGAVHEDSPTWREFTGQTYEEWRGAGWLDAVHPDDRARSAEIWQNAVEKKSGYEVEYRIRHRSGEWRWTSARGTPILDSDGAIKKWVGMNTDISERKRHEELLRRNHETFFNLVQNAPFGIYIVDADFRLIQISTGSRKVFNNIEPLIKRDFAEILRLVWEEPFASEAIEHFRHTLETGETYHGFDTTEQRGNVRDVESYDWKIERVTLPDGTFGAVCYFYDLTVQKQIEQALRESEERMRLAMNASAIMTWEIDVATNQTKVSDNFAQVFNFSEQLRPIDFSESINALIHPEDTPKFAAGIARTARGEGDFRLECRLIHPETKAIIWIEAHATLIEATANKGLRVVGIVQNINERKRAEENLRETEEKFRTLADNISQLAWMTDASGYIFWYNERWFDYTGTTLEEMESSGWQTVLAPEEAARVQAKFNEHIASGEVWEDVFPLRAKSGEYRWFLSRALPIRDLGGNIIRWFGTNTDIDEQRRLDQRNRFIIEIDEAVRPLETPEEITLTLARLLGEYLGVDRCAYAEVEADEDHFYIPGDYTRGDTQSIVGHYSMADFGQEVLRLMRENEPYVVHDVNNDPQVTENDLAAYRLTSIEAVICVPLHKNGRFSACMAVHQKTPRRWLPEEVELVTFVANRFWESIERARIIKTLHESLAREKESRLQAEAANRLKDEFLATVSHELRTPLNAILGWSSMLQARRADEAMRRRAIETIYRSAKSQAQLIEDLLDVSRIISGNLRIQSFPVNLAAVVESSIEILRPASEAKSINLEALLETEACQIFGDAQRLQQIIWNLVSNAVKFTPEGGTVLVKLEKHNSRARLTISDTGKGIEAEFLPFIFERFRQQDGSTTRRHGGLGLGLAIVRSLTELHGGSVWVESGGLDQGATFTVELPLLSSHQRINENFENDGESLSNEAADTIQDSKLLKGVRVLLVDDELDTLELLDALLTSEGAEVRVADSAQEAFEIFSEWQPDVLISDIGMPDEDGYSLINRIRQLPLDKGGITPAIAMTAYGRDEDRMRVLASGFHQYIAKPAEPFELIAAIAGLIGDN
jgi:PAS domain S-box-containing protein